MVNILLKKTFKTTGFKHFNEKELSFHGAITQEQINIINQSLQSLRLAKKSKPLHFQLDEYGHYATAMNHDFQKYHEEDAVCAILDVMENLGFDFKFQYDQELYSEKITGQSFTKREVFIFKK
mmetsp:Transcript_10443/g.14759  ORF Transcript_10443/g.14759 Transcript_10443/m.14759 type:complete len:123 (-) Transcript_10443:229-597(-)